MQTCLVSSSAACWAAPGPAKGESWTTALSVSRLTAAASTPLFDSRIRFTAAEQLPHFMLLTSSTAEWPAETVLQRTSSQRRKYRSQAPIPWLLNVPLSSLAIWGSALATERTLGQQGCHRLGLVLLSGLKGLASGLALTWAYGRVTRSQLCRCRPRAAQAGLRWQQACRSVLPTL